MAGRSPGIVLREQYYQTIRNSGIFVTLEGVNTCVFPLEISPQEVKEKIESGAKFRLIDVREPFEFQLARISGSELIPMRTIPTALQTIQREATLVPMVFFCHHGIRSLQVVNWLREHGVETCQSMQGGIERWSREIDPSIPRYH